LIHIAYFETQGIQSHNNLDKAPRESAIREKHAPWWLREDRWLCRKYDAVFWRGVRAMLVQNLKAVSAKLNVMQYYFWRSAWLRVGYDSDSESG
jgi:hypothetical protein